MKIELNTLIYSYTGIFKIIEWLMVLILVLVLRFTFTQLFMPIDVAMTTYGTIIAYIIIVSVIIANYILGATNSYLEFMVTGHGTILFTAVGGVNIHFYNKLCEYDEFSSWWNSLVGGNGGDIYNKMNGGSISGPIAIGVLSIFTAAVFLADFSLMI